MGPNAWKIEACGHKMRRGMLRLLRQAGPLGPARMAIALEEQATKGTYHIKVLETLGLVELVGEEQVRGATEHFYESLVNGDKLIETMLDATQEEDEQL